MSYTQEVYTEPVGLGLFPGQACNIREGLGHLQTFVLYTFGIVY